MDQGDHLDIVRRRAIARCAMQLQRLGRLARELEAKEIFEIACEFLADTIPICRAHLVLGHGGDTRALHWETIDAPPSDRARSTIDLPTRDRCGLTARLTLELLEAAHIDDGGLAEGFMLQVSHALSRSRSFAQLASHRSRSGTRAALSVLVVAQDDAEFTMLAELLELDGYRVRRATDGVDALAAMRTELPAVMVLALRLPPMDGRELRRRQLADPALRDVPVIVTTPHEDGAFDAGVVVLSQPFDPQELGRELATALLRRGGEVHGRAG